MTETVATDWAAAVQPLRELFDRLVVAVRSFLTALGELFRRWWRVMSPTLPDACAPSWGPHRPSSPPARVAVAVGAVAPRDRNCCRRNYHDEESLTLAKDDAARRAEQQRMLEKQRQEMERDQARRRAEQEAKRRADMERQMREEEARRRAQQKKNK